MARAADTREAYRDYLASHPDGAHAKEVRTSLADRERYALASADGTPEAYEAYLAEFPNGRCVNEARVAAAKARDLREKRLAEERARKAREEEESRRRLAREEEAALKAQVARLMNRDAAGGAPRASSRSGGVEVVHVFFPKSRELRIMNYRDQPSSVSPGLPMRMGAGWQILANSDGRLAGKYRFKAEYGGFDPYNPTRNESRKVFEGHFTISGRMGAVTVTFGPPPMPRRTKEQRAAYFRAMNNPKKWVPFVKEEPWPGS